jgi:hypothetical protein
VSISEQQLKGAPEYGNIQSLKLVGPGANRANIFTLGAITKGRAMSCCSLAIRTFVARGPFNVASDWAGSCTITIKRRRERGGASYEVFDHTAITDTVIRRPQGSET